MSLRRTRTIAALAAASALTLSACGGDSTTEESSTTETSTSASSEATGESSTESATESPSETESAEGDDAAAQGSVTATKSGLTFDVPDGWETIDPSALAGKPQDAPESIKTMAEDAGMPVDQFLQNLSTSIDVLVMGEAEDGFAQNINVIANPAALDTAQLKANLEQQNATVTGTEEIETEAGTTPMATYTMPVGEQTVHGAMIAAPSDSGAGVITVSTLDEGDTEEIAKTITDSVKKS